MNVPETNSFCLYRLASYRLWAPANSGQLGAYLSTCFTPNHYNCASAFVLLQIVALLRPRGDAYVGTRLYSSELLATSTSYYTYFSPLFLFLNNLPNHASLT